MLRYYTVLLIIVGFLDVAAQDFVVRGNIKDESDLALIGATVVEINDDDRFINGTISDFNGNYVLQVGSGSSRIQVSFIGYKTIVIDINNRSTIDVKLQTDATNLAAIDVVAERITNNSLGGISDKNRVGAVAVVDMSSMEGVAMNDVSDAMQGQVAGLDIISSGTPGESANIVIRGLSTIGDATPLIVVDGIAQDTYADDFDFATADVEDLSALLSVPTQDIKEIRVLKDATEAAIWGARGANGVIEIDTHQGRKGKTRFSSTYKYTLDQLPKQMPMLSGDEYIMMQQEQLFNNSPFYVIPDEIAYNPKYFDFYNYSQNTNWYDEITQNGRSDELTLKVEGGGDNTNYYISVNTDNQRGMVINEGLKKLNARVNLQYVLSKNIKLTTRFSYLNSTVEGNWGNALGQAYIKAPNMSVYEYDALGNPSNEYFTPITNYQGNGVTYFNPVAVVNLSQSDVVSNRLNSDFILDLKLGRHVRFQETVSLMNQGSKASVFLPQDAIGAQWNDTKNNSAQEGNKINSSITTRSMLMFTPPKHNDHELQGSLMWETYQTASENTTTSTALNISNLVTDPASNAVFAGISSSKSEVHTLGMLARVSYNYKDKYVITSNIRGDAFSRFGKDKPWGIFPSVGVKWRLKDEPFMKGLSFIDRANFSLSWGRAGNIPSAVGAYSRHGIYDEGGQYMYDVSVVPTQAQLDGLKWETKDEISSSLDLGLLKNNKLTLVLEYYSKKTYDVAWSSYGIPTSSGYSSLVAYNGGEIRNEGYDVTLRVKDVLKTKEFSLLLYANLNNNRNWFEELPPNQGTQKNGNSLANKTYPLKTQLGSPIGSIFGLKYLGVYSSDADAVAKNADGSTKVDVYGNPVYMVYQDGDRFKGGDAIYQDINYDGVININDAVYLGDSNPKLHGGFGGTAKYKNFSLISNFVFRTGFSVVNMIALETESMNDKSNQSKATLYRWRKEGDDFEGMIPRAYSGHQFNSVGSDRYVEDGSYLKFNSLTLSYNISNQLKKKIGVSDLRISLTGRKIFTWTNYSGQNPEINTKLQDPFWVAEDNGRTPPARSFSVLLTVTL